MGKLRVFHQPTNTVPLKYHHRSPGQRTKSTNVLLTACRDVTGTNPGSSPEVPGISPMSSPPRSQRWPDPCRQSHNTWRSVKPFVVRCRHQWVQMLQRLPHPDRRPDYHFRAETLTLQPRSAATHCPQLNVEQKKGLLPINTA